MSWNGSGASEEKVPVAKERGKSRGVILAAVGVVALGLGAYWFFATRPADEKSESKVTHARANVRVANSLPKPQPKREVLKKPESVEAALANVGELERPPVQKVVNTRTDEEMFMLTNRTFKTGAEQLFSWVFTCELGDMPMPIPNMGEEDRQNIVGILLSKNPVSEKDSETVRYCKETVDAAKKECLQYLKNGGDPDEFLRYYHAELRKAYEYRSLAIDQAREVAEAEPGLAKDFLTKVNERLESQGIKRIAECEIE